MQLGTYNHSNTTFTGTLTSGNSAGEVRSSYLWGFNGYEKDDEIRDKNGADYDFDGYGLDVLLGRRKSLDPAKYKYPSISPYSYSNNNPIIYLDISGGEFFILIFKSTDNSYVTYTMNAKDVAKEHLKVYNAIRTSLEYLSTSSNKNVV